MSGCVGGRRIDEVKDIFEMAENPENSIWKTLKSDWKSTKLKESFRSDMDELKSFYLNREQRTTLSTGSWLRRWFLTTFWLMRVLFFRLSPFRRLLFAGSLILLILHDVSNNNAVVGGFLLLFVLMLELKDKLLARQELEEGHAVQEALMPPERPTVEGWDIWLYTRSANEVGGDLLDAVDLADGRHGLALGDLAGKGLKAALMMAKLQATIRALVFEHKSLAALAEKLNQILYRDGIRNSFASLIYLEVDTQSNRVRFVNAGHMPPLVINRSAAREIARGGVALGLVQDTAYIEQEINLGDEEMILIYSDGLTEARNEAGEFYGDDRLLACAPGLAELSASQAGRKLLDVIKKFSGDAPPHDDLSLMIIKTAK